MFHAIPPAMARRMAVMQEEDAEQRRQGLPRERRYCQVPPVTGRFLALLCASAPAGVAVEVGTSAGYSAMWLSLACKLHDRRLLCFEKSAYKAGIARETFALSGIADQLELFVGDAREGLSDVQDIGFAFLDAEKSEYGDYFELCLARTVPGGVFACDNITSHESQLADFRAAVEADPRVDALMVPIGKGVLVARKL